MAMSSGQKLIVGFGVALAAGVGLLMLSKRAKGSAAVVPSEPTTPAPDQSAPQLPSSTASAADGGTSSLDQRAAAAEQSSATAANALGTSAASQPALAAQASQAAKPATAATAAVDPVHEILGPTTASASKPQPATAVKPVGAALSAARSAASTPKPATAMAAAAAQAPAKPVPTGTTSPDPLVIAAQQLVTYVTSGGRERQVVADLQRVLGADPDGIVGDTTKTQVVVVLKKPVPWPKIIEPKGAAPKPSSAAQAASDLWRYVNVFRGVRPDRVKVYQTALGVAADGVLGPKTKAAYAKAAGKAW